MAKIIIDADEYDRLRREASRAPSNREPTYTYGDRGYAQAQLASNGGLGKVYWDPSLEGWKYEYEPDEEC